jgi:hypothetical protein
VCKGSFQEHCQTAKPGQIVFISGIVTDRKEKFAVGSSKAISLTM